MSKIQPLKQKAAGMNYLGKAGGVLSSVPVVGKYFEAFGQGVGTGIEAMTQITKDPTRPYGVSTAYDPQFKKFLKTAGVDKDKPLKLGGAYLARALGDITTDETRKFYWRFNHPLAIADEMLQKTVDPTKSLNRYEQGIIGLAALQPAVAVTGAYDPTNLLELGRPKGFKQNNPTQEDKTKTVNPSTELFQRFVQGRTGRPLKFSDAQKEIPNLTKKRYANYLNFLYNNPDPLGKATGGFIKTTGENLQGNPEARFLGYPVSIPSVTSAVGGIAGARMAIASSPDVQKIKQESLLKEQKVKTELAVPQTASKRRKLMGRAMVGGIAGAVPGIIAGKLINQALSRSELDKQPTMHPYK
tara:strand:+ start:305 stop:1375 length:1071 start_codon:yes stop_codon:yes gene_type:complete